MEAEQENVKKLSCQLIDIIVNSSVEDADSLLSTSSAQQQQQRRFYDDSNALGSADNFSFLPAPDGSAETDNLLLKPPTVRKISFKRQSIWEYDHDDNWIRRGSEFVMEAETDGEAADDVDCSPCCRTEKCKSTFVSLCLGQILSLCLCGTGVASQYLGEVFSVNTPTTQSFCTYFFLCFVYGTVLSCRSPQSGLISVVRNRGWRYFLVALCDVEANYLIVRAYQYTNLTSIQLLDCFTIPVVLLLSWLLLRVRYLLSHIIGVAVCLFGIGCVVAADILQSDGGSAAGGSDRLLGDMLCLAGAGLYGVGNVAEEHFVKAHSRVEYLGMIGLFGSVISGLQLAALERHQLAQVDFANYKIVGLFLIFTVSMFTFYSLVSVVIRRTSATLFNLSILTADFYTLLFGALLFKYKFHALYFASFVTVMIGSIVYSCKKTRVTDDDADDDDGDDDTLPRRRRHRRRCCAVCCGRGGDVSEEEEESIDVGGGFVATSSAAGDDCDSSTLGGGAATSSSGGGGGPTVMLRYCPVHGATTRPQRRRPETPSIADTLPSQTASSSNVVRF